MQKITPFLWFDSQAEEATNFYTHIFTNSKINKITYYDKAGASVSGRNEGSVMTIGFELCGQGFVALNGGPFFQFTPATSFFVACDNEEEINLLWGKLSEGGSTLMELGSYPFSKRYGWLTDKYGVSWQLILGTRTRKISTAFLFVGNKCGKVEEAINSYTSLFENANINNIARYEKGEGDIEGNIKYASFSLDGVDFIAMESNGDHKFSFSQAVSLIVHCDSQIEIDKFWEALSNGGEIQQCGWVVDKYGITWQIVPTILDKLLADPNTNKSKAVMEAMLKMNKLNIKELENAYNEDIMGL